MNMFNDERFKPDPNVLGAPAPTPEPRPLNKKAWAIAKRHADSNGGSHYVRDWQNGDGTRCCNTCNVAYNAVCEVLAGTPETPSGPRESIQNPERCRNCGQFHIGGCNGTPGETPSAPECVCKQGWDYAPYCQAKVHEGETPSALSAAPRRFSFVSNYDDSEMAESPVGEWVGYTDAMEYAADLRSKLSIAERELGEVNLSLQDFGKQSWLSTQRAEAAEAELARVREDVETTIESLLVTVRPGDVLKAKTHEWLQNWLRALRTGGEPGEKQ